MTTTTQAGAGPVSDAAVMTALEQTVADAIDHADDGYSIRLTGLSGSESTYTLDLGDGAPLQFPDIDDARDHALRVRSLKRAQAAIAALAPPAIVPESVRRMESGDEAVFACACARWVRTLLSTPSGRPDTPPAGGGAVDGPWPEQYASLADGYGPVEEWRDWTLQAGHDPLSPGALHALRGMVGEFAAPAAPEPAAGGGREIVRHKVRGTDYEVLGEAEVQVSGKCTCPDGPGNGVLPRSTIIREARPGYYASDLMTVYRSLDTGKLWCRLSDEFRDGRFETVTDPRSILSAPTQGETGGGDGWHQPDEAPEVGRRYVQLSDDGSCAYLRVRYDGGVLDADGSEAFEHPEYPPGPWAYAPVGYRFWCEDNGDDRITLPEPTPADAGAEGGQA